MAKKAGMDSEQGGAGGESSPPRMQRFAHAVPISKVLLVGGATRMPCIGRFLKRLTGLTVRPVVDPEEAVALGAAVSAGILSGAIDQKVYNPFFDEKMAPTTSKGRGRKKKDKVQAASLSVEEQQRAENARLLAELGAK